MWRGCSNEPSLHIDIFVSVYGEVFNVAIAEHFVDIEAVQEFLFCGHLCELFYTEVSRF